jgi:hypothetical protein
VLKFGEIMSVDSAIWYLECTSNYTYGDATARMEDVSKDSSFITIPVGNGYVNFEDIEIAYNRMIDSIRNHYYSLNVSEKQLLLVRVDKISDNSSGVDLRITSTIVYGGIILYGFGPTDFWWAWDGVGKCNGYTGGQGKDAATEIQRRIMLRKGVQPGNWYYTDPICVDLYADFYPIPGVPPSNSCSHYMWWEKESLPDFHFCLNPDELNFYLLGTEYVIYDIERPAGYSFVELTDMYGTLILNSDIWIHYGLATYGILHQSGDPPASL